MLAHLHGIDVLLAERPRELRAVERGEREEDKGGAGNATDFAEYVDDLRDDDLPGAPGDADHSWFALMQFNVATMIEALGGDASAIEALVPPTFADDATYPQ